MTFGPRLPAMDILVVGGGPAGMALAAECARLGLDTGLLDPSPDRPWTATYGMWSQELPPDLPESVVAARAAGRVIALTEHRLGWEYAVLDVPALHRHLADRQYLMGDQFTVADAYLFTVTRWTSLQHIDLSRWPNISAYMGRVAARPKVVEAMQAEGLIKAAA